MNATDLCLIIDNDRELLGNVLARARAKGWEQSTLYEALRRKVDRMALGRDLDNRIIGLLALLTIESMSKADWQEVADHYARKVAEGVTV